MPSMMTTLPPLSPEMQKQGEAMLNHLEQLIQKAGGHISFAHFMKHALYAQDLGYYTSPLQKFGETGDFVTAPEISPLFAKTLARQFAAILSTMPEAAILELGAGTGIFAKEVMTELKELQALPSQYYIFEASPTLIARQKKVLETSCPQFFSRFNWLTELPDHFQGIIFANEWLDALPVHCFRIENKTVTERCVTFKNKQLTWKTVAPQTQALHKKVLALMNHYAWPEGYESEINLLLPRWIKTLAKLLDKGVLLFFDYGYEREEYYHPERSCGTLRAYFQHRMHADPFLYPGLQDLTAHVDFTTVVEQAISAGLDLAGYTTQQAFLIACGIGDFANSFPTSQKAYRQNQALKLLLLPSEMGSLIKAVAFTKNWNEPLDGFSGGVKSCLQPSPPHYRAKVEDKIISLPTSLKNP
ncbi:MAG TPA: SAM-dependent methyltransferase, partial [Gammaproteobacteria bacterium]|nr:SAM-dependent methyltransferase [Gammaproteobacteria bacterium]